MKRYYLLILTSLILSGCKTSTVKSFHEDLEHQDSPSANTFSIIAGEEVSFEAIIKDGVFTEFIQISQITKPAITLTFNLISLGENTRMMLAVKNPFDKAIKYHIELIDFSGKAHQTSSCPVGANMSSFESWGHPIPKIKISEVHFVTKKSLGSCVY